MSTCATLGYVSSPAVLLVLVLICATIAGVAFAVEVVGGAGAGAGAAYSFCSGNASVTSQVDVTFACDISNHKESAATSDSSPSADSYRLVSSLVSSGHSCDEFKIVQGLIVPVGTPTLSHNSPATPAIH